MPGKQERKGYLNIRFSDTARWILDELQDHLGLSQASVVEMLLREEARRRDITIPGSGKDAEERRLERLRLAEEIARHAAAMGPKKAGES